MNIELMSNEQIIKFIADNLEKKRQSKKITSEELAQLGGHKMQTYSNFINKNTDMKISTLIQVLRGLGELEGLQKLIEYKEPYRPLGGKIDLKKRIRKSSINDDNKIEWGE